MKKEIGFFDKPKNIRLIRYIFYLCLIVLVAIDFFIERHSTFAFEKIRGFYAFYGFLSCAVIILVSKLLGIFLKRKEDYYD